MNFIFLMFIAVWTTLGRVQRKTTFHNFDFQKSNISSRKSMAPALEIIELFVLRILILQTRMRSHPVGLDVWFFGRTLRLLPCVRTVKALARLRRLAQVFAGRLCDNYHNLMSWLNFKWDGGLLVKSEKRCVHVLYVSPFGIKFRNENKLYEL